MPRLFTLGDQIHREGDLGCPACTEGYPERCPCGGFMHATEVATEEDVAVMPLTQCDRCSRSKEDLEEEAAA